MKKRTTAMECLYFLSIPATSVQELTRADRSARADTVSAVSQDGRMLVFNRVRELSRAATFTTC